MKKCLLFLAVLSLAFSAGSAIRCYECSGDACQDPYSGNSDHEVNCSSFASQCGKIELENGDQIERGCTFVVGIFPSTKDEKVNRFQEILAAKKYDDVSIHYCDSDDLCNGSGRLAEISTMMILLPASLVLLISYFSRL